MWCGWFVLAASLGQATQPAAPVRQLPTFTYPPPTPAATQPAATGRPRVVLLPPLNLATQPAANAPAAQPGAGARGNVGPGPVATAAQGATSPGTANAPKVPAPG